MGNLLDESLSVQLILAPVRDLAIFRDERGAH
jgi:hypothetical protein